MLKEDREAERARWRRIEEIYHDALRLGEMERRTFVAQHCAGDTILLEEINSLLAADDAVEDFLQEPIAELGMALLADETLRDTEIVSGLAQAASTDMIGEMVAGRYEIIKRLGGGGFGDVYKAADTKIMSRLVIIKVLKGEVLKAEGARRDWVVTKFKQEIEALAKINDPGVVRILDADTLPDDKPYIVMEFVEGSNLRQFIKDAREGEMTEQGLQFHDVAEIVRQVGRTLTAAHEDGIFHRDLKPENIMVRRNMSGDLQVKIIDFGIAKVRNSLIASSTATGLFVAGTWQYMAPEQLRGKKIDAACDIYALGVIAYELLTGRCPFPAKDSTQLKEMQEAGVKVQPCDLNPDLPVAAQAAILKALEYYPAERQARARDFGDELSRTLVSAEELVRPVYRSAAHVNLEGPTLRKNGEGAPDKEEKPVTTRPHSDPMGWRQSHRRWIYAVCFVLLAGLLGVAAWIIGTNMLETQMPQQASASQPNADPERTLTFWLHVREPKGDGTFGEFDSTGEEAFKVGSKIYFRAQPTETGYLYIINEGMGKNGAKIWTAIFPNPKDNNKSAQLAAGIRHEITGMTLDDNPGDEIIHLVWATEAVRDLEPLFQDEFKDNDGGVFANASQQKALVDFFQRNGGTPGNKSFDNGEQPRAIWKGRGSMLVNALTIKHRKYGN